MATTENVLQIVFFDGIGENLSPYTANFVPPTTGDFSLSNLGNSQLGSRTRTPDLTTDRQISWDLGATPPEFNVVALMGGNPTINALRRVMFADNSGFAVNVVQSGGTLTSAFDASLGHSRSIYTPPWGRPLIYIHPTSITKRYIRWHQSDISNPDGFQSWGIFRVGLSLQYPFETWKTQPRSVGMSGAEKVLRGHEFSLNITRPEAYDLESVMLNCGTTRRLLVIPEGTADETWPLDAIWCTFESMTGREAIAQTAYNRKRYRATITFREVDR